jgi:hypothetical protein
MVRRRRRADGSAFWGCPRYPECRGTRAIDDLPEPPPVGTRPLLNRDRAGASAERQFERRRAKHEERVRQARPEIVIRGVVIALIGIGLVVGAPSTWSVLGWAVLFFAFATTVGQLFVLPQHVTAWDTGGEGERLTAAALEPLRAEGFVVFHDRAIPMSVANVDHVIVGPSGVWVIETKHYKGRIRVDRGDLVVAGHRRPGVVEEVEREGHAVARVVAPHGVKPIIVVHRGEFQLLGWPNLRGVPVVTPKEAVKRIRRGEVILTSDQIADIAAQIDRALPPALGG